MTCNHRAPNGYRIWGYGSFAHICLESIGCRFHRAGYCAMCDYGEGKALSVPQAVCAVKEGLDSWKTPVKRLLLGTCGSIFDEEELSREALFAVICEVAKTDVESVIFETHYSTVTPELLRAVLEHLPNKKIAVELGFESSNPEVLKNSLHKYMNLNALKGTLSILREYSVSAILNVFLGAPRLTPKEQLEDSLNSIRWAYSVGADEVVIFPANVKPGTELWKQWVRGAYEIPSSWLLVELLNLLSDEELEKTSISWFGDRQYLGIDQDVLPPATCALCKDRLMRFYFEFMSDFHADARRKMLKSLLREVNCTCRTQIL